MTVHRQLFRSAGAIGSLTAVSRVLGFVRDLVIATAFGTGIGAEAFVVSFRLPNLLRDLVGEGAANAAFVPVLTECRQKHRESFWPLVWALTLVLGAVLTVLAVAGIVFAPAVVRLIAPGFALSQDPDKLPLTILLTRTIFPYLLLIGLSALAMGVLNSLGEFTSSALGPILLNLSMIAAGVFFERRHGPMALVAGVLAGGTLQLACQLPALWKAGWRPVRPAFGSGYVSKIGRLLVPRALGSAVYQINVFVDSILASFETIVGAGGQSALYYANRLFQLPLAIFGLSLAQALLPTFSAQAVRGDLEEFRRTWQLSVRTLLGVLLPATAGLAVLAGPIVRIIFEHGRFDAASTAITTDALFYYSFGLVSCCLVKILANAFYALQDTRTPVRTMAVSVAANVLLSLALMGPLGIGGLTLASSLSATLNVTLLYRRLGRRVGPLGLGSIAASAWKAAAATLLMSIAVWGLDRTVLERATHEPAWLQAVLLAGTVVSGLAVYVIVSWRLGAAEWKRILPWRS